MSEQSGVGSLQVTENDVLSHACDLFRPVTKEISLIDGKEICIRATNLQSSEGPFMFTIPPQSEHYIQLASAQLWGECKIVVATDDGGTRNINDGDNVSIVNMLPSSLFRDIRVELNNVPLSELSCANANIKAYIETILTYGTDALRSHLQTGLFQPDTAGQFDAFGVANQSAKPVVNADGVLPAGNYGYHDRKKIIKDSRTFDFQIPLSHDFIQADRLIIPGCEVKIELIRANDAYSILSPDTGKKFIVQFKDLRLFIRIVKVAKRVADYHSSMLKKEPAVYPINRSVIRVYNASKGDVNVDQPAIFRATRLPKSVIIGMVATAAYNGSYSRNPLNLQTFDLNYTCLNVNNEQVPLLPYTPDFPNDRFMREYKSLFTNTGIHNENIGTLMSKDLFKGGCYLQAYDLSPCQCNGFHTHDPISGQIDLVIRFGTPLPEPITILVMGTFDGEVYMDSFHNVLTNFNLTI